MNRAGGFFARNFKTSNLITKFERQVKQRLGRFLGCLEGKRGFSEARTTAAPGLHHTAFSPAAGPYDLGFEPARFIGCVAYAKNA